MSKWEQAKILMRGFAYLATGIAVIFSVMIGLGIMLDTMATMVANPDTPMPLIIQLLPLLAFFVGMGWGAFFISKSYSTAAPLTYYLIGKAGYRLFHLHSITMLRRKRIASLVALVGFVMVLVVVIQAIIVTFPEPPIVEIIQTPIAWLGILIVVISMAISDYEPKGNTN